jgi:myo-inositol-1(or 4)-monophosphatase
MYEQEMTRLVIQAGKLMNEGASNLEVSSKGRANFVTQMDVAVQEFLRDGLAAVSPYVTLLAEEQDNLNLDPNHEYWILDPIDGTQNYIRHLRLSAISLAYYANNKIQTSIIYNPDSDELFYASRGRGAYLNGHAIHVTSHKTLAQSLVAIGTSPYDRQFTDNNFPLWKDVFSRCLDLRRCGSAALDLAYVAAGRFDVFFERNLRPWDKAAGLLLIEEAGGKVTNYKGEYPSILENDDICAANRSIHSEVMDIIHKYWPVEKLGK